jgi:hypothetical protein
MTLWGQLDFDLLFLLLLLLLLLLLAGRRRHCALVFALASA